MVDTREKKPYLFRRDKLIGGHVIRKVDYGDYEIDGRPDLIVIERKKSVDELVTNFTRHRARFVREMEGMRRAKYKYVIIEDHWSSIMEPGFSKVHPKQLIGSIFAFEIRYGVHFIFCGNRRWGMRIARQLLTKAYYEELKEEDVSQG